MTKEALENAERGSKKVVIPRLPANWRESLFKWKQANSPRSQSMLLAMAVARLTGCRPDEIETGVKLEYEAEAGKLHLIIAGSKVRDEVIGESGQEELNRLTGIEKRTITHDVHLHADAEVWTLISALNGKKTGTITFKAKSFGDMWREMLAAIKADKSSFYWKLKDRERAAFLETSPYCYRHAMAYDLLSCPDLTPGERSAAMGHKSTETIKVYGRKRRGRTNKSPVAGVKVGRNDFVNDPRQGEVVFNARGVTEAGQLTRPMPTIEPKTPRAAAAPARGVRGASPKK